MASYGERADRALALWVKLARCHAVISRHVGAQIRSFGLTLPQFGAIECLGHLGPLRIGELSRKMLVSGGNMTCVVDNLEREGLVCRDVATDDGRSFLVRLTAAGKKLFNATFPEHAACVAECSAALSREEQEELSRLLKKLGTSIPDHPPASASVKPSARKRIPVPEKHGGSSGRSGFSGRAG